MTTTTNTKTTTPLVCRKAEVSEEEQIDVQFMPQILGEFETRRLPAAMSLLSFVT